MKIQNPGINNTISIHKEGKATSIGIMARIGSRYEPQALRGISHFVEHMVFKGSKKYSADQINTNIEKYG
jgi:zinc protease